MHHFSIRDMENLTGIKAHSLRIWEQRFGLNLCKRKESKHRYYDNDDLKHMLRISFLYHNGYKISQIANMSEDEIVQLAARKLGNDENEVYINHLLEASFDLDHNRFEKIVQSTLLSFGLERTMFKIIYPYLTRIGVLWLTNHVLPAQEHFSSCIIRNKIIAAIDHLPVINTAGRKKILLFSPEEEYHEIPLLLMQYQLKKNHHPTVLMGTNVSIETLQYYCKHKPVSQLYVHVITNLTSKDPGKYLDALGKAFSTLKIVASGPSFSEVQKAPYNVRILRSLEENIHFARE
jgi:MerR family transcriptional regulator, light-induced transcriptional regulator